jgi:glutamate formiminotransferase/formiminotetrahydrofolate cyclodeaminase
MLVDGRAQVSMNLTNFHRTPMARVVEFIRGEARRYGVAVHHSELVGLIPQEALVDAAVWYMQMDQFDPEQVLEQKLYAALEEEEESSFLDRLAAGTPTPGGGSAAAQAAAMGAGLVSMVVRTTLGKRQYERVAEKLEIILEESEELRDTLTSAVEEDAAAFKALMEAYRLPADDPGRSQSIQQATLLAARVPLRVMRDSLRVMSLALEVAKHGNLNAITDAAAGLDLAHGALKSASYNVRINIQDLDDQKTKQSMSSELDELEKEAEHIQSQLEGVLRKRAQLFSNT